VVVLAAVVLAVSMQLAPGGTSPSTMAGRWTSTVQPRAGEAPAINPSFVVEVISDNVTVGFGGEKERYPATAFRDEQGQFVLVLKSPDHRGGIRTFIVRPIAAGQVRLEVFVERQQSGKAANFCFSEVFRKSQ
jgi:hypothetical protein